ncbi:MAG TPA: 30S ribosomal protein S18 [Candidatus Acidoferrales bacterium]|nr:30S ribosomal protein S18 [Candidatus Acidoferrales bacterium]
MADPNKPEQPPAAANGAPASAPAEQAPAAAAPQAPAQPTQAPAPQAPPQSQGFQGGGGHHGGRGPSRGPGGPGGGGPGGRPPGGPHKRGKRNYVRKKKVCRFCVDRVDYIDYKKADILASFIQERGKILPRRMTGTCARHQRWLTVAIKRAQNIALLPFAAEL